MTKQPQSNNKPLTTNHQQSEFSAVALKLLSKSCGNEVAETSRKAKLFDKFEQKQSSGALATLDPTKYHFFLR